MTFALSKEYAMICEGPADSMFFHKLLAVHHVWGVEVVPGGKGWGYVGHALTGLAGNPSGYEKLKGVIIAVDAGADPQKTHREVCKVIKRDGPFEHPANFRKPRAPFCVTRQPPGHPHIAIIHLPLDAPGALETVCIQALCETVPWINDCVTSFLECGNSTALKWSAEKRDKARLQCMIAALNEKDPSKSLKNALEYGNVLFPLDCKSLSPIAQLIVKIRDEMQDMD